MLDYFLNLFFVRYRTFTSVYVLYFWPKVQILIENSKVHMTNGEFISRNQNGIIHIKRYVVYKC